LSKIRYGKTNPRTTALVSDLKAKSRENEAPIWRAIAEYMEHPNRSHATVNLSRINRHTAENESVVVPGKVLGAGELRHPVAVGAFNFSEGAELKITDAGGECLTIEEMANRNPSGANVRIIR